MQYTAAKIIPEVQTRRGIRGPPEDDVTMIVVRAHGMDIPADG
jgi:hypothetical protein